MAKISKSSRRSSGDCILIDNHDSEERIGIGDPICGANLSTHVVDISNFIGEIHYQIGNKLYIENADSQIISVIQLI